MLPSRDTCHHVAPYTPVISDMAMPRGMVFLRISPSFPTASTREVAMAILKGLDMEPIPEPTIMADERVSGETWMTCAISTWSLPKIIIDREP